MDHRKFEDMTQSLTWKVIIDKLIVDFEILNQFKMISFKMYPIYFLDRVELRVLAKEMTNYKVPSAEQWKLVEILEG